MADYKRLVSYVYTYEYGKKSNNVGFVKVDSRNGMCKIIINFKLSYMPSLNPLKVYFLKREDKSLIGILLGIGKISGSTYEFKDITNSINIKGSGYGLDEMSGIYICDELNKNIIYASEWDNRSINPEHFIVHKEISINDKKQSKPVNEQIEKSEKKVVDDSVIKMLSDYVKDTRRIDIENNEQEQKVMCAKTEDKDKYEYENKAMEFTQSKVQNIWDQLYNKHTKIAGLKNIDNIECIKIKPQDLACLPNKYWVLGNNSFLLHGFYIYRYLLFVKINNDRINVQQYKLGVPGVYHQNEKIMASMFGFNEFLEADQENKGKDVFGYWCMDISIP